MPESSEKTYHHGDLRGELLKAAARLLREKGVGGLSLREVARVTGVSHAAPYRHFKDKAALLAAVAEAGFAELTAGCRRAEAANSDAPARQLVDAGVGYVLLAVRNPERTQLMFGGALAPADWTPELHRAATDAFAALEHIIENGQRAGAYRGGETRELALAAWSAVHGLAMLVTAGQLGDLAGDEEQVRGLARMVTKVAVEGIGTRD
jgi:AcrR family transcriptional regulator